MICHADLFIHSDLIHFIQKWKKRSCTQESGQMDILLATPREPRKYTHILHNCHLKSEKTFRLHLLKQPINQRVYDAMETWDSALTYVHLFIAGKRLRNFF
jgi:hypothetical protein